MIPSLKSEFRKIFTIRSTYVIALLIFAVLCLFDGYVLGFKADGAALLSPTYLAGIPLRSLPITALFISLVGVLSLTHEYRYSTILYSLSANKRWHFMLSKILVISLFSVVATLAVMLVAPFITIAGGALHGHHFVGTSLYYASDMWRGLFFGLTYSLFGLLFGALIRNQIGSIVAFLLVPGTIEGLLSLILKGNAKYLPFTALSQLVDPASASAGDLLRPGTIVITVAIYLLIGWAIAWVLFLRRDAN